MITQRDLVSRLARRSLGAWSVVERIQDLAIADELRSLQRRDHRTRLALIVHQDVPRGRGSARLDLDAFDGSADDLIDQAISLALAAVGPAWSSTPPAAPAKVSVADDDLIKRELEAVAQSILTRLRRPPDVTVTASAEILREKITVIASSGFHASWLATTLRADALVSTAGPTAPNGPRDRSLAISREARRADDLNLDTALAEAADDLLSLAAATPPTPGPCALWLGPEALLHGDDYGVWTIFAHQADSAVERQGLTRYRWHSEISPGAAQLPEPLSITSDGALDFATRSTPVTDDAVAIRRFPLIRRGIAVGLGLSPREAALRNTDPNGGVRNLDPNRGVRNLDPNRGLRNLDPNGGVRNLVVDLGSWPGTPSATTRTIEVRRLHALSIDPYTGDATLDIALGFEHRPDRPAPTPFTGGTIRLDLVTALARARRGSQLLRRGAYHGPASILIDDAELMT